MHDHFSTAMYDFAWIPNSAPYKKRKKVQRITVSLPETEYKALFALAERFDVSLSWLTRRAIVDFLEKNNNEGQQISLRSILK